MEMSSALWWSHEFLERFEASRGYNPRKYLPLMFHQSNTLRAEYRPYNNTYMLNDDLELSGQNKYLQDYRLTLNEGYREYLATIEEWAQSLSMEFSVQPAYNLPLDMVSPKVAFDCRCSNNQRKAGSAPVAGGPEAESPRISRHRSLLPVHWCSSYQRAEHNLFRGWGHYGRGVQPLCKRAAHIIQGVFRRRRQRRCRTRHVVRWGVLIDLARVYPCGLCVR